MLTMLAALTALQSGSSLGDPALEARINTVLAQMTLEEKIDVIAGVDGFYVREMPKAGLPRLKMSDGPVGVRNDGPTTAYPAGFTLAATWDPALANRFGTAIGRDARARGVHIWLGPGVNLARIVQNGRNFEYVGEDPFLAGRIATEIVKGVQEQGVAATIKHFAANEHESDRNNDDSIVDERTLRELYLKPFEMVVKDASVATVMTSYNLLNGAHASASKYLMNDVLKGEWGFKGLVMSDWGGVHETDGAFLNGLDLEMPDPRYMNRANLLSRLQSGALPMATLDDKVRRILRVAYGMGWDKRPQKDASISLDDPANAKAAIEVARQGMVLLKNRGNALPLVKRGQKILVVGPNADTPVTGGGGSAYTTPNRSVSVRQALERLAPAGTKVSYLAGYASNDRAFIETKFDEGLKSETFGNRNLEGEPTRVRTVQNINMANSTRQNFSTRWTGQFTPKETGQHLLVMRADDGMRVYIDGEKVFDEWHDQAATTYTKPINLTAGKPIKVVVEYYQGGGDAEAKFGIVRSLTDSLDKELPADVVRDADAVVACVGFKGQGQPYEGEGSDRTWELPAEQEAMLRRLVSLHKRVIVVLNAGAGVATKGWIDGVAGFVHAGYPGGEGNLALAEILYGKTSPSGKLPTSFPAEIQGTYYANAYPSVGRKMVYREGPFIGYRWFDANNVAPLYPFGYGLSYSSFALSKPSVIDGEQIRVSVDLKNTGKMAASETVQVYAEPPKSRVSRAPRELRAFKKVTLAPGQSRRVTMSFDRKDLAWYDARGRKWVVDPGTHRLKIGTSSRNLPLAVTIQVPVL